MASNDESADFVVLGKIVAPYGVRGAVRVFPFADDRAAWSALSHWWLGSDIKARDQWQRVPLSRAWQHKQWLIAQLGALGDRTAAEAVCGLLVGLPRALLPLPEPGEYYWHDLVGLSVTNTRNEILGQIVDLLDTPANTVIRVLDGEGSERLLPFVAPVVLDVDLTAGVVHVDWEADW